MKVERVRIVLRGLTGRCPNCGRHTLFPPGLHFRINRECPACGLRFDRGDGFFLGPFVVNYTLTVFGFVVPCLVAYAVGRIGGKVALGLAGGGAALLPLFLYRLSWRWWLAGYFALLPDRLPANEGDRREEPED
ncbi:MAG: DUF983 domain-containing protein [Verrucomicrobia bacterium]|nr:DUF983 domain-containing protein [Verrucomicrobiota bacterium]